MFVFSFLHRQEGELVRKVSSLGTNIPASAGSAWHSHSRSQSHPFLISWTPLPVNCFPGASTPCVTKGLWSEAALTRRWITSSLQECSKWEGWSWYNILKEILSVKIEITFFLTLLESSTSAKSPNPELQVGWMCTSGRVKRSRIVPRHQQRQSCCFPWHKVTFELWSQQEPRAATSHRSQIWSVE